MLGCIAAGLVTETRGVIIFTEDVGVVDRPLNVSIYQGWANSPPLEFSGTGQVQSNKASGAYEGASGQSNVFLNNGGRTLTISNIDTLNYSDFGFAFGADKSSTQSDLTELIITFDSAIGNGSILFPPQPTARGSKGWRLITATSVPLVGSADLSMTFRNTASTNDVQLDDITLSGAFRTGSPASDRVRHAHSAYGTAYVPQRRVQTASTAAILRQETVPKFRTSRLRRAQVSFRAHKWSDGRTECPDARTSRRTLAQIAWTPAQTLRIVAQTHG